MAGIGFQLRKLGRQETITSVVASAGHAAVIAAGPWLFTIFSLASITVLTQQVSGLETLATFRVIVIYAFAASLVLTAPVTIVATRLMADALWSRQPEQVRPLLLGAYACAMVVTGAGVALLLLVLRPAVHLSIVLMSATLLVSLIWVTLAFCGAVRDYWGVTMSFLVGMLVSLVATVSLAIMGAGAAGMAGGFVLGLAVAFLGMAQRVLATFPHAVTDPSAGVVGMLEGMRRYWHLAAGALAGTAGVWIDKWLFWLSPEGEAVEGGFLHSPLYDSAMFIASLAIIPSLAAFVVRLETDFFDRYQQYYATIKSHGTIGQIEAARARLAGYTLDNLTLITVTQAGVCAVLVLSAPLIVDVLSLQFRQTAILRFGALGAVFQFVFVACSAMLLFFDRRRLYLALQLVFLALSAGLTVATLRLGEDYHGVGYFLACLVASFAAYRMADTTFDRLNFLTFIGNNPSIEASKASRRRRWLARRGA
jgi:uncharacterized membrane protein